MLDDGSLDLVASVEGIGLDGEEAIGFGDLSLCGNKVRVLENTLMNE